MVATGRPTACFKAIDLWAAYLSPAWATPTHYKALREASREHGVVVSSIAGGFGKSLELLEKYCQLAVEAETTLLGIGGALLPEQGEEIDKILGRYGVKLAFENHPEEKTPADVLAKIGDYPNIGSTLDTGWFATYDYPVVDAIEELKDRLLLVHLKNIKAPGGHEAAAWNNGYLDMEPIVRKLVQVGYTGYISLEYEPLDHDPRPICKEFREAVETWIANS